MHVAIVGLGLIGGSIARAIRSSPDAAAWEVDGWSPTPETREAALQAGVIDRIVGLGEAVSTADLVVLAAPPLVCLDLLDEIGLRLRSRLDPVTTITDVASTKARILQRADSYGLRFVGGHPMAGREASGFAASVPDLFVERPWVLVKGEVADDADLDRVAALVRACRARPRRMAAAEHDEAVAAVSHVPLVVSAALVEAVTGRPGADSLSGWAAGASLAAGGWRDMTRVSRGDPAMGAGIVATNAGPIADGLRRVRSMLDEWIDLVEGEGAGDPAGIEARFAAARIRLGEPT